MADQTEDVSGQRMVEDASSVDRRPSRQDIMREVDDFDRRFAAVNPTAPPEVRKRARDNFIAQRLNYVMSPEEKHHWQKAANTYAEGTMPGIAAQNRLYPLARAVEGGAAGFYDRKFTKNERERAKQVDDIGNYILSQQQNALPNPLQAYPSDPIPNAVPPASPPLQRKMASNVDSLYNPDDPDYFIQALMGQDQSRMT